MTAPTPAWSTSVGTNATDGVGLATFLLGDVSEFTRYVSTSTNATESQPRLFFYGQDTWRANSKLTLNIGLRYELIPPESVNGAGNGATLDISNGLMYVFGYGNSVSPHGIQTTNYHDFAPRIGVAYQLNQKTVIRAGYGWSYDLGVFGSNFGHNVTQNPPVLENQTAPIANNFTPVFTLASGPPTLAPIVVSNNGTFPLPAGINPKYRPATVTLPQLYQYNASIQRQVTNKVAVTASYVGNSNRHGFLGTSNAINPNEAMFVPGSSNNNVNRPYYPIFGWTNDLSYYCDCANENYNALQVTAKVNALAGWTLQANYTYQRQWGPGWDPYDSNYYFIYDRAAGYGYSNTLPRNQITLAQTFEIPVGKGRKYMSGMNRVADGAIGGWTLSGVTTYYSGFPFSPTFGNSYAGQPGTGPKNRPASSTVVTYENTRAQWFSASTVAYPSANTFGNFPINTLFGPHFIQQDITLAKTFKLTEKLGLQLRFDSSNIFNHTNLASPSQSGNTNIDQSNAGQITNIAPGGTMRRMQFSGTVRF